MINSKNIKDLLHKKSNEDLIEIYETAVGDADIFEVSEVIKLAVQDDTIAYLIDTFQQIEQLSPFAKYIYQPAYYKDWKTADEVADLLTEQEWIYLFNNAGIED